MGKVAEIVINLSNGTMRQYDELINILSDTVFEYCDEAGLDVKVKVELKDKEKEKPPIPKPPSKPTTVLKEGGGGTRTIRGNNG